MNTQVIGDYESDSDSTDNDSSSDKNQTPKADKVAKERGIVDYHDSDDSDSCSNQDKKPKSKKGKKVRQYDRGVGTHSNT